MRHSVLTLFLLSLGIITLAQIPQGISYQAVAFNSSGLPISNTTIQVKSGILSDTLTPVVIWEEIHPTVRTNKSGVFNIVIGEGTKQAGSASSFSNIDWSTQPLYLQTQIFYQNSWKKMGTRELWSVPFAMAAGVPPELTDLLTEVNKGETAAGLNSDGTYTANPSANYLASASSLKDADNKLDVRIEKNSDDINATARKLAVKGIETSNDSALFRVVNKNGQTVIAVYNEGVRIFVDDGAKGTKGGFAVGGFGTDKAPSRSLLIVNKDSIRAYIDTNTGKGVKGGFAVGGFGTDKGGSQDYLMVTGDSTRIYLNNAGTKGVKGGFAVGGYDASKGDTENYLFISTDSTRFYVRDLGSGSSSTFDIVGINQDQSRTLLLTANTDTLGIGGVLNVQNNMNIKGDIVLAGEVNLIVPDVITLEPYNITDTSALVPCNIVSNGGAAVTVSGVVWSTSPNPTVNLPTKTTDGTSLGLYTSNVQGLTEYTVYYIRAYATNANGTGYGNEIVFSTYGVAFDYDGNMYIGTVTGTQIWLIQNLKTTHLTDGTPIPNVTDDATWMSLITPGYAWYNNDAVTYADYGILYNWATVNTGLLCPTGWHVPSEAEVNTVVAYGGGPLIAGGVYKEVGTAHWLSPNTGASNDTGFGLLPGGIRSYMGPFSGIGENGNFWTSTKTVDPLSASVFYDNTEMLLQPTMEGSGLSIRCIKN